MPDNKYPDLQHIVGRVVRDPEIKETAHGDLTEVKVSVQVQYGKGKEDFGVTKLVSVAVWNAELQERVLAEISKGQMVAVEGNIKKESGQYADMSAFRIGPVAFISKNGTKPSKARQYDDTDAF